MRKSLKQFIFEKMEKNGYVYDDELATFQNREPNFYQAEVYKAEYLRLKRDREFFTNKKITKIEKYRRSYKAKVGDGFYRISKAYFNELKPNFVKDNSRPDLAGIEMYILHS